MRILAIDMGTGTQDILLFDSKGPVENSLKMVMPSATEIAAAVMRFLRNDALAGRVMLCYEGKPPRLVPVRTSV